MVWVESVEVIEQYRVRLKFNDGVQKTVDLAPLLHGPIFERLRADPNFFREVRVDEALGTIVWPNGADMDPAVLYGKQLPAWMESAARISG